MPSEIRFRRHFVGKKTVKRAFSFLFQDTGNDVSTHRTTHKAPPYVLP
ncbi:hypothetical protein NMH_2408 [Neisseria meningitidis H44/76]|uniref:Uncharacterized protein n=2 Tax=Neisseria meningitidis TaxID=487 RepID=E6N0B3_NEIMH|nr:hypothetical protein NMH_2408 [Neisseria meningitidis H44/76]CCA45055.1 hypothetical protein NMALPHA522_1514 [Neisseria meningitidis alpha522]